MSKNDGPSGPARRAIVRWAWRLFQREWRQQLLLMALMTMTVAAAVAGASMAVNASSFGQDDFGDANSSAQFDVTTPEVTAGNLAGARARFGTVETIGHRSVSLPGSVKPLDLRTQDPNGTFGSPLLALRKGRYPVAANELALTRSVADLLGAQVGDRIVLDDVEWAIVGEVENPNDLKDEFALTAPDDNAVVDSITLLFDNRDLAPRSGPPAASDANTEFHLGVMSRGSDGPVAVLVLIAATVAMALVGLVAASGFVVVAQRRQRQLGLLSAIGATERHLRLVMLANGAFVGAVAALIGTVLGVAARVLATSAVESAANHRLGRFDLPWSLIIECGLLAIVMATAAAWWPARSLSRMPVMAALSARPTRPRPVRRSLAVALALLGLGVGGIAAAHPTDTTVRPVVLVFGMLGAVIGVVFAAPAAIRGLAVPAARLPFAARLALRDLVRYQARSAAALAAITLGLGISISVVGIAQANEYRADDGNLSSRQLVIRVGEVRTATDPNLTAAERASLDTHAATVAATLGKPTMYTLDVARNPTDATIREPVAQAVQTDPHSFRFVSYPFIATPELLAHYDIDPATINADTDLLTTRTDEVTLLDFSPKSVEGPAPDASNRVQVVDLPSYSSAPNALITEAALSRHGWVAARAGWLIEMDKPLTTAQIAAARSAAADVGLAIETRSTQDSLATLRTVATTSGALLALAIVAMTIGLIRSEAAADLRTLTATGAASHTRRTLTACTAGALAVLGIVLGAAGAYAALIAGFHSQLYKLTPLPFAELLPLAVGLPLVAMTAGWLLAGREPRTFSRQTLD
ncbi:MAG: FtsX-like permease family protein [Acidimicrobiales bacterium]